MRVLITGASGLIGSAVCDALLARGDEAVGLTRDPARARTANPTVSWHAWDPAHERPPEAAFEGVDGVVNLIGEKINQRSTDAAKQRIRDSRVRSTKNLVDGMLAAAATPDVLVSQCAVGYYGERGEAMVDESTPPGEDWTAAVCVAWEDAALAADRLGRPRRRPPQRAGARPRRRAAQGAPARRSSSESAARWRAATSTCPGSTATTRSG